MNILNGLPYWAQGAVIRAIRTFILLFAGSVAVMPIVGVPLDEFLKALALMVPGILVVAVEKAIREFRLDKANGVLTLDAVADSE